MPTPCWFKHLCSIRALVAVSFFLFLCLSLSLPLYFWLIPWSAEARWAHSLGRASNTLWRRRTACSSAGPKNRALLAFRLNQAYQPLSLLLSGPPGSGPLKDQQVLSASFSLLLSYRRLRITRFQSIKGPTRK